MTAKIIAQAGMRWFGTLGGRLTILLLAALAVGQATTIFYLVEVHERERALGVDQAFFGTLLRSAQAIDTLDGFEREAYLRSIGTGGLSYWVGPRPALEAHEAAPKEDSPPLPEAWALISSDDKRVAWYEDARPFSMKYRVFQPPPPPAARLTDADIPADADGLEPTDFIPAGQAIPYSAARDAPMKPRPAGGGAPKAKPRPPEAGERPAPHEESEGELREPEQLRSNPAYGEAASRRPTAGFGTPPIRWRAAIMLSDGQWLNGEYNYMAGLPGWVEVVFQQNMIVLAFTGSIIILGVALTTQRLSVLARAADRVGRGDTLEPIHESGTSEVRGLTQSFNTMSLRLRRFIEGRTQMLGAISHDLRTPITGLRLRAELVDDDENRDRMLAIIDELHHLTEATLALAREDSILERTDRVDVTSLVESIADDLSDVGMDVSCTVERGVTVCCRPFSLRRAIRNLAENGVKYGKRSRITLNTTEKYVRILIDDDGPGIPEDQLEKALLPFVRLEGSRSRETGGAGLGLAITRSIVLNHGGDLRLANRREGGLRAEILLPRDA
ncbi:MAG: ATP-binding protein [Rhodospirillaceae bacterium]